MPKFGRSPAPPHGGGLGSELGAVVVARDEAVVLDSGRHLSVSSAASSSMERKPSGAGGNGGGSRPRSIQLVVQP